MAYCMELSVSAWLIHLHGSIFIDLMYLGLPTTPACFFSSLFPSSYISSIGIFLIVLELLPFFSRLKMEKANAVANSSKGGKSAKVPPRRGQVILKVLGGVAATVTPKNNKAKVQTNPEEGGTDDGNGGGSGNGSGSGGGSK